MLAVWSGLDVPWASPGGHGPTGTPAEAGFVLYDTGADRWTTLDAAAHDTFRVPARMVAPVVPWRDGFVVVGGEPAPGFRTPAVSLVQFRAR